MYDVPKIHTALNGLVGYQQSLITDDPVLDADSLLSSSGRYFTSNSYVKHSLMKATHDKVDMSDAEYNAYLKQIKQNSITSIIDRVFDSSDFIDRQLLYQHPNNKVTTDVLPVGFVGYKIKQPFDKNYCFEITRDILEFEGTGDVELLLYNTAVQAPVQSQTVSITSNNQAVNLNWRLDNTDGYYKGDYYYGYLTSGLTVLPIKRDYNNANVKSRIEGLCIENVQVIGATGMFDLDDVDGASECWGLNPDITVYDDYTDLIIQNKQLFAYSLELQGQIKILYSYITSIRSNRDERISSDLVSKLIAELEGANTENWNKKGLVSLLSNEISRLKQEVIRIKDGYFANNIISVTRS